MHKPRLIVFSSGKAIKVAEAVKQNLERGFVVDVWTENFFDDNNSPPLNTFLKKLMCYDVAVLILGDDDVQLSTVDGKPINVPRDNVIFELGATMARMGTRKTFLLTPEEPHVKLPTYFKGIEPLTYCKRSDENYVSGTGSACAQIRDRVAKLDQDAFHSDLPAVGLAYGYYFNLIKPLDIALRQPQTLRIKDKDWMWKPEDKFAVTIVMPSELMNRDRITAFMGQIGATNVLIKGGLSRDVSVYALPPKENNLLRVLDIPTTLLTSERVIRRVDNFWGGGDRHFKELLTTREINGFARRLRGLIEEEQLDPECFQVLQIDEIRSLI